MTLKPGALFVPNEDVIRHSNMGDYVSVIERAYAAYGEKKVVTFQRQTMEVPADGMGKRSGGNKP